jgi:DNA-binding phage protein
MSPAYQHLKTLAENQRWLSMHLRDVIEVARAQGLTWDQIGDALGIPRETVYRQFASGGPISVVRPTHKGSNNA